MKSTRALGVLAINRHQTCGSTQPGNGMSWSQLNLASIYQRPSDLVYHGPRDGSPPRSRTGVVAVLLHPKSYGGAIGECMARGPAVAIMESRD